MTRLANRRLPCRIQRTIDVRPTPLGESLIIRIKFEVPSAPAAIRTRLLHFRSTYWIGGIRGTRASTVVGWVAELRGIRGYRIEIVHEGFLGISNPTDRS